MMGTAVWLKILMDDSTISIKTDTTAKRNQIAPKPTIGVITVASGHWEYTKRVDAPYNYSDEVCHATFIHPGDCNGDLCSGDLMNWRYYGSDNEPYPTFNVDGFRKRMQNKRIMFLGDSTMRQHVLALIWTLGYRTVSWDRAGRGNQQCMVDGIGNITICRHFMGNMAARVYREDNYTLDLKRNGTSHGDTSYLLDNEAIDELAKFDIVFIQGVAWFAGIPISFDSPISPRQWTQQLLPKLYRDAWEVLLIKLSTRTKVVVTLGQTGTACVNKTAPEPYDPDQIPNRYGWTIAVKLWQQPLDIIRELSLDVQVVDAREPLMQSLHAHKGNDCLHFCMTSAAVNIYLDMYWNEVFAHYGR